MDALVCGKTVSCGCKRRTQRIGVAPTNKTHGMSYSSTWVSWMSMVQRCTNKEKSNYKYYGGRGIKVCKRWMKFENFLADMGVRPRGKTIDRKDNDGNYCKDNCRWATRRVQATNRRRRSR